MPIRITITGPRGSGKTTVALLIGWVLRMFGQNVIYHGATTSITNHTADDIGRIHSISEIARRFPTQRTLSIIDEDTSDYDV